MSAFNQCDSPPEGWYCNLEDGHDGPCPARSIYESSNVAELREHLFAVVYAHKINCSLLKNEELTEYQKEVYRSALDVLDLPADYMGNLDARPPRRSRDELA